MPSEDPEKVVEGWRPLAGPEKAELAVTNDDDWRQEARPGGSSTPPSPSHRPIAEGHGVAPGGGGGGPLHSG